jgi:hypothetical protein
MVSFYSVFARETAVAQNGENADDTRPPVRRAMIGETARGSIRAAGLLGFKKTW